MAVQDAAQRHSGDAEPGGGLADAQAEAISRGEPVIRAEARTVTPKATRSAAPTSVISEPARALLVVAVCARKPRTASRSSTKPVVAGQPGWRATHRAPGPSLARHRPYPQSSSSREPGCARGRCRTDRGVSGRAGGRERRPGGRRCRVWRRMYAAARRGLRPMPGRQRRSWCTDGAGSRCDRPMAPCRVCR